MLDCNLEYKKGESQTNLEFMQETDFRKILQLEENYIKGICDDIIALKPDLVLSGKKTLKQNSIKEIFFNQTNILYCIFNQYIYRTLKQKATI